MAVCGAEMITFEDKCVEGIERRGRVFYMRIRVPAKYASVEKRKEINRSLKTRDYEQAKAHFVLAKEALRAEWEFLIAQQNGETSAETYDAALNMLHSIGFSFKSQSELFSGPLDRLLTRIEALEKVDKTSATVPAILGVMEYPVVQVSEAPQLMVETNKRKLVAKIDAALRRIEEGEYGYCIVTGDPISLKRLDARPIATMSLEAQERHERREKVHRDD